MMFQFQSTKKIGSKLEPNKVRTVNINWKHRKNVDSAFIKKNEPGHVKFLTLNSRQKYSVQQIIDLGTELFNDHLNQLYFKKCDVQLGRNDNQIIRNF